MSPTVPPSQRVHRILKGSPTFISSALQFGRPLPKDVVLSLGEELLGAIRGSTLESILTTRGAYFRSGSGWRFVAYGDIEDVSFPEKSDADGALRISSAFGSFDLLAGRAELWDVGRFYAMLRRCKNGLTIPPQRTPRLCRFCKSLVSGAESLAGTVMC